MSLQQDFKNVNRNELLQNLGIQELSSFSFVQFGSKTASFLQVGYKTQHYCLGVPPSLLAARLPRTLGLKLVDRNSSLHHREGPPLSTSWNRSSLITLDGLQHGKSSAFPSSVHTAPPCFNSVSWLICCAHWLVFMHAPLYSLNACSTPDALSGNPCSSS